MEECNANKLSCKNFGNGFSKIFDEENINEMNLQHMQMVLHYSIITVQMNMFRLPRELHDFSAQKRISQIT